MKSSFCQGVCITLVLCFAHCANAQTTSHRDRVNQRLSKVQQSHSQRGVHKTATDWSRLGDAQLRAGRFDEATKSFEVAIKLDSKTEPFLWQYGIALFFANRFDEGKLLFEKHRVVNPHDVENAAWHFLCVAKAHDVNQARKILLPAPDDRRTPMRQILKRLALTDDSVVMEKMETAKEDLSTRFYGNLYLGLIADAEGRPDEAIQYIKRAAQTEATHYMADVARVYQNRLEKLQPEVPSIRR